MLKVSEIRVGNIIESCERCFWLHKKVEVEDFLQISEHPERYRGLKLDYGNFSLLKHAGWVQTGEEVFNIKEGNREFQIEKHPSYWSGWLFFFNEESVSAPHCARIEHYHQLQNLWFAYHQKELLPLSKKIYGN